MMSKPAPKKGRPSVLTEPLKVEIGKRLAAGESLRAVSKSTGVSYSTLRDNFSAQVPEIRDVAQALASAESRLLALPVSAQHSARSLADQLKDIQDGYAQAAARSTKTAVKVANLAGKIADEIPEESFTPEDVAKLAAVDALSKTMNAALQPAANLIAANKSKDQHTEGGVVVQATPQDEQL